MKRKQLNISKKRPPYIASRLLDMFMPEAEWMFLSGDFTEIYNRKLESRGRFYAWLWYWFQALISILPFLGYNFDRSFAMLKNYFKTAYRNIKKYKLYSSINILGLAIGIACCLFSYNFIRYEFSFDRFHKDADRIYEVATQLGDASIFGFDPGKIKRIKDEIPEVDSYLQHDNETAYVKVNDNMIKDKLFISTPNFFEFFTFPLIHGNSKSVLEDPKSVVLTEASAIKYFGTVNAVGKTLSLYKNGEVINYNVSGIAANSPINSTLQFTIVVRNNPEDLEFGKNHPYLKIMSRIDKRIVIDKINNLENGFFPDNYIEYGKRTGKNPQAMFFSFVNTHLKLGEYSEIGSDNKTIYSYILLGLSIIVLLIASFNYMNLTSGNLSFRLKELGIRKVVGANRKQLLLQIMTESQIVSISAFFIGLLLYNFSLPVINNIMNTNLDMFIIADWKLLLFLISLVSLTGLLSALFPAIIFSKFNAINIFKNSLQIGKRNFVTRVFIVLQFALSITLIISTSIMYSQRSHYLGKDLGFNPENVINIPLENISGITTESFYTKLQLLKSNLLTNTDIKSCALTSMRFDDELSTIAFSIKPRQFNVLGTFSGDYNFMNTYEISLIEGESFSPENTPLNSDNIIVNEKFVEEYGISQPVGKFLRDVLPEKVQSLFENKIIIGVVKNTNVEKLTSEIMSVIFELTNSSSENNYLALKLNDKDQGETLQKINAEVKAIFPDMPYSYTFVTDDIRAQYAEEERWEKIISYTSMLAILIACSGLFALALLTVVNRLKEIGIRKVLGSSRGSIVSLLNREFLVLILIANVIAWPAAYYAMNQWLENFVYRIDLGVEYFLVSGLAAVAVALATVSYHTLKAANSNPVEHLRNE